jgi:hypothetical protein
VVDSLAWIDRPFMGFVLGRNRIVAPLSLSHWTGLRADIPFGSQLVSADGHDVVSCARNDCADNRFRHQASRDCAGA